MGLVRKIDLEEVLADCRRNTQLLSLAVGGVMLAVLGLIFGLHLLQRSRHYRLLAHQEERFRRVLEESEEAIAIAAEYRLIFANILLEPLKAMATPLARLVAPNGCVVLSGLLAAQARAALASYRARGFVLACRIPLEGWMTLVLVRRARDR